MRLVSVVLSDGFDEERSQPFGIDARAFGQEFGRQLLLDVLIVLHSHQDRALLRGELVAAHAVVLLDHPPAFLNIAPCIAGFVLIAAGQGTLLAAQQERGQGLNLLLIRCRLGMRSTSVSDLTLPLS